MPVTANSPKKKKHKGSRRSSQYDSTNLQLLNKNGYCKFNFRLIGIEEAYKKIIFQNQELILSHIKAMEFRDADLFHPLLIFENDDELPDPSRSTFEVFDDGVVSSAHPEMQTIYDGVMHMCDWIFSKFPTCDKSKCHISVLKTQKRGLSQVEHFDWSWVKEKHMMKVNKNGDICDETSNAPWKFTDSASVLIQLEGESKLSINKSARDYYISSKDKCTGSSKLFKKMLRLKYIHVPSRVKNYVPSDNEDIDVISLLPGDFLIFFGWVPHCGFAAENLLNRRIHIYIPTRGSPVPDNNVFTLKNTTGVKNEWFAR